MLVLSEPVLFYVELSEVLLASEGDEQQVEALAPTTEPESLMVQSDLLQGAQIPVSECLEHLNATFYRASSPAERQSLEADADTADLCNKVNQHNAIVSVVRLKLAILTCSQLTALQTIWLRGQASRLFLS